LWPMVLASNGGVVAAGLAAARAGVAGSLSSGLHHARHDRGAGFCTFNGLVIAAKAALAAGIEAVLIIDLDAHCGGGTYSLVADDDRIWQLDVSTAPYDTYRPAERTTLDVVSSPRQYLRAIADRLAALSAGGARFGLCLYNAGMDPCELCDTGGLDGVSREMLAERERMVFAWCARHGIPVAFVLAGGYIGGALAQDGLVDLHRLTLSAAAGR
jgi:acetoin utilization deacetylase AcuC-like enzyme